MLKISGTQVKAGRWYQVFEKSPKGIGWWKVYDMLLCYIGLHQGWLAHHNDHPCVPLVSTVATLDAAAAASASGGAVADAALPGDREPSSGPGGRSVGRSNRCVDKLLVRCKNYFHVAYTICQNDALRSLWIMMLAVTEPQKQSHGETLVQCETREGAAVG